LGKKKGAKAEQRGRLKAKGGTRGMCPLAVFSSTFLTSKKWKKMRPEEVKRGYYVFQIDIISIINQKYLAESTI
jgi:hypothetical protein